MVHLLARPLRLGIVAGVLFVGVPAAAVPTSPFEAAVLVVNVVDRAPDLLSRTFAVGDALVDGSGRAFYVRSSDSDAVEDIDVPLVPMPAADEIDVAPEIQAELVGAVLRDGKRHLTYGGRPLWIVDLPDPYTDPQSGLVVFRTFRVPDPWRPIGIDGRVLVRR